MTKKSRIKSFSLYLRGFFQFGELSRIKQSEVMLFCHDFTRNYNYKGLQYSSLIDSLNELFLKKGMKPLTIARPYSVIPPDNCFGEVFTVNGGFARVRLADLIFNKLLGVFSSKSQKKDYFQKLLWERIIKKISPKMIIGVEPFKEICVAARTMGIPVFDVQHGIIACTPSAHFYRLVHRDPTQAGWPDFIIARDPNTHEWLGLNRSEHVKSLCMGHPWLSRFSAKNIIEDQLVVKALNSIRKENEKPVILYSLQHLRDENGYPHSYAHLPGILERYMTSVEGEKYNWWIRLHPILLSEPNYSIVTSSLSEKFGSYLNIQWECPTIAPLPCVLRYTNLHFTRDSSLTSEAAFFGVKTGILDKSDNWRFIEEAFRQEINSGMATILNVDDLSKLVSFIDMSLTSDDKYPDNLTMLNQSENFELFADLAKEYVEGRTDLIELKSRLMEAYS